MAILIGLGCFVLLAPLGSMDGVPPVGLDGRGVVTTSYLVDGAAT